MRNSFKLSIILFVISVTYCAANSVKEDVEAIKKVRTEAEAYFENHQYDEALNLYLQLEGKTLDKGVINYMIGMCYLSSDHKEKALEYLEAAKESRETSFVINYYLGRIYYEAGHHTKALNYLSTYLKDLNSIDGLTFKPYKNVPEEHLIHYQKSARDVNQLMDRCRTALKNIY